ncbi:hypothetical protein IFM89_018890 [Coptis chinensis]|uniref:DUF7138 domain-containing protein n=1 Tax=Coptis chinensis TaxID=261450 RepID=A0A835LN18_9MAGN|nr:hypothetical protein IFM89_018890 [Coptis chinensis]
MTEFRPTVYFPVVFFDGECEIDIGNIGIYSTLDFNKLQSILSQKIGISPHQLTVSLVYRKKLTTRKIQINDKVNLGALVQGQQQFRDCYFLASLKQSRKGDYCTSPPQVQNLQNRFSIDPPQKLLLRRDSPVQPQQQNLYGNLGLNIGYRDYENELQLQKENYLMSLNSYPYTKAEDLYEYKYGRERSFRSTSTAMCEVCMNAKGRGPVPFHLCVYDPPITAGWFRSPAGPIARPSKGSH